VSDFDLESAHRHFIDIEALMKQKFKSLSEEGECRVEALDNNEKIALLAKIYRGNDITQKTFDNDELDVSTEKAHIAPDSIKFMSNHIVIDEGRYAKSLFIRDLPADCTDELINALLSTQIEQIITVNIKPVDIVRAKKKVKEKLLTLQSKLIDRQEKMIAKNNFGDAEKSMPIPFKDAMNSAEEHKELLDDKKQKLFSFNMIILIWGDSLEDLAFKEEQLKAKTDELVVTLGSSNYNQELTMQSILPIGFNNVAIKRTVHSEAMGLFHFFDRVSTVQLGGFFYSLEAGSKQPVVLDINQFKNPSGFILGSSGAGKGVFIKALIQYIRMTTDDDIIIIDPENENERFVTALGGQVIELSSMSQNHINPFDIPVNDVDLQSNKSTAAELKLDLILAIIGTMTSGIDQEIIRSVVDDILRAIYTKFQESRNPSDIPTFQDFYDELEKMDGEVERWLKQVLRIFAKGSWNLFSYPTNVQTDNNLICYNTSRLGDNLKAVASFIMFDAIWNRVAKNRNTGKKTWVFVDEAHIVLKNPEEIARVENMYRRVRKYDGRVFSITQNTADIMRWPEAQTMLQNSDFVVVLKQHKMDRELIQGILSIPDGMMPAITNSGKGEGLIFAQGMLIHFANVYPNDKRSYELITTNSEELAVILPKEAAQKAKNLEIYGSEYITYMQVPNNAKAG